MLFQYALPTESEIYENESEINKNVKVLFQSALPTESESEIYENESEINKKVKCVNM